MSGDQRSAEVKAIIARLVKETGITEAQALDLIEMLGVDWSSLVREAREIRKRR